MKNKEHLVETISYLNDKSKRQRKEYSLNHIHVFIKDEIISEVSIQDVLDDLQNNLPSHLMIEIDAIYVGKFDIFQERGVNAIYQDGAIYVSNVQNDTKDMVEDIVHEIAHVVEHQHGQYIYADQRLSDEFLGKRKRLYSLLKAHGHDISFELFKDTEYNEYFDEKLYKDIGYSKLSELTKGLFNTPYAATSLQEYFATGFEDYFTNPELKKYLTKVSPVLYYKIRTLEKGDEDEY